MRRIALHQRRLGAVVGLSLLGAIGCSSGGSSAPETIEGKTPAEYREAAEVGIVNSIPDTPKATAKPDGRKSR